MAGKRHVLKAGKKGKKGKKKLEAEAGPAVGMKLKGGGVALIAPKVTQPAIYITEGRLEVFYPNGLRYILIAQHAGLPILESTSFIVELWAPEKENGFPLQRMFRKEMEPYHALQVLQQVMHLKHAAFAAYADALGKVC